MKRVIDAVRRLLEEQRLLRPESRLLCAVSGGPDSVALLLALHSLRREYRFFLGAVHIQHGLRGEDSREDERFTRELCERLSVPLTVKYAALSGDMNSPGAETRAREARYALLRECMTGADAMLTAHHRDDQAETVLMHLLRGSGLDGLTGMRPASPFGGGLLLRPLLDLSKSGILDALEKEGFSYRTDGSNFSPSTPRNALRLDILPRLEELFPGCGGRVSAAAESLSHDAACLDTFAEKLYHGALISFPGVYALRRSTLAGQPEALVRRALRRFYADGFEPWEPAPEERNLSREDTLALTAQLREEGPDSLNLPRDRKVLRTEKALYLTRQDDTPLTPPAFKPVPLGEAEGRVFLPGGVLTVSRPERLPVPETPFAAVVPPEFGGAVFRLPEEGDRFRPLGAPGHKSYRHRCTDLRLDPPLRAALPVLALGKTVLWVPGLASSEELRAGSSPSGSLLLRYSSEIFSY